MRIYLASASEILRSDGVSGNRAEADKRVRIKQESCLIKFHRFLNLRFLRFEVLVL